MAGTCIYHLVEEGRWKEAGGEGYLPPTYDADGFIHACHLAAHLLPVANNFYTDVPGKFLCLRIDTTLLKSEVKYEPAAPVGDKPAKVKTKGDGDGDDSEEQTEKEPTLFPHIYGPIDVASVTAELVVNRSEDGAFLSIEKL
ncbi:unnamed protein product [Laminaria digitata]